MEKVIDKQENLFSPLSDVDFFRHLVADLHDDLDNKVARFRQLADLSMGMGAFGTMIPGETSHVSWLEARSSFIHGNFIATVMLCQGLAEHVLASHMSMRLAGTPLPVRLQFKDTLERSLEDGVITEALAKDLKTLMALRNPLSHFRDINDPSNLSRRAINSATHPQEHLLNDATFAISAAVRLLSLPVFRLDSGITIAD
jgi:hypothetical protein